MDSKIIKKIEEGLIKKRPEVKIGDTVKLHLRIKEGSKERIQVFEGVVISITGSGLNKNYVVRKISYGVGVEKIVPVHSPVLAKVEVVKRGSVRRAKLFYLRDRVGRRALKVSNLEDIYMTDEEEVVEEAEEEAEVIKEDVVEEKKEEVKEEEAKEESKKEEEK